MVRHVVCFRPKEGTTPEPVAFKLGPDMAGIAGNWNFAVVADFDSIDDQTIYRDHLEHQRTDLVAPIRADRAAVQCNPG
jgi:Stress responsive A/B Barrel Domain